ncbi:MULTISPECIES: transposase [unclassified Microcoleus]|uniref:transposase n=1 Tax=unclassified Microcoleus TaxID=2642155 RepID=UPI002FD313EC
MIVVERHYIDRQHQFFKQFDNLSFLSINLYNHGNYYMRKHFFKSGYQVGCARSLKSLYAILKPTADYKSLPAQISYQFFKQVLHDGDAWKKSIMAYSRDVHQFLFLPKIKKNKAKICARNLLIYDNQLIGKRGENKNNGLLHLSQGDIIIVTKAQEVIEVRIVSATASYVVEVVYKKPVTLVDLNPQLIAGIDLEIDNLVVLTSNQLTFTPTLYDGKYLQLINQCFNKRRAFLQSKLDQGKYTARQIQQITFKRNKGVKNYLPQTSSLMVKGLVDEKIGQLVIGKNVAWKQNLALAQKTHQTFVVISYAKLREMIAYKAELVGIEVTVTEESYTSKCSFWDLEPVGKQESYQRKRVKRGLFRSLNQTLINSNVNAALLNMIKKINGNSPFEECRNRIEVFAVSPVRVDPVRKEPQKVR